MTSRTSNNSDLTKPPDCTCAYPTLIARNMCGHTPPCPVYERWAAKNLKAPGKPISDTNCNELRVHIGGEKHGEVRRLGDLTDKELRAEIARLEGTKRWSETVGAVLEEALAQRRRS